MWISVTFMSNSDPTNSLSKYNGNAPVSIELQPDDKALSRSVDRDQLIRAQKTDATLPPCLSLVKYPTCEKSVLTC